MPNDQHITRKLKAILSADVKGYHFPSAEYQPKMFQLKTDILLKGNYKKLFITNCDKIRLLNATVEQMTIENSEVTIENSIIQSSTYAINATDSICNNHRFNHKRGKCHDCKQLRL